VKQESRKILVIPSITINIILNVITLHQMQPNVCQCYFHLKMHNGYRFKQQYATAKCESMHMRKDIMINNTNTILILTNIAGK